MSACFCNWTPFNYLGMFSPKAACFETLVVFYNFSTFFFLEAACPCKGEVMLLVFLSLITCLPGLLNISLWEEHEIFSHKSETDKAVNCTVNGRTLMYCKTDFKTIKTEPTILAWHQVGGANIVTLTYISFRTCTCN